MIDDDEDDESDDEEEQGEGDSNNRYRAIIARFRPIYLKFS